jgi:hypothetical protein
VRRFTPEEKYKFKIRNQQKTLEEFAEHEIEWANHLMYWYSLRKQEMPDDEYRACAFFTNKEYRNKPGSLTLCYEMFLRWHSEMPQVTKENAFDILCFQFKMYANVLRTGGFDGQFDWG